MSDAINWHGQVITITTVPQRLTVQNLSRRGWRVFNLGMATSAVGRIGYNNDPNQAYIPLPADASYPVGSGTDNPVESNELWYHGVVGDVIGFAEA